MRGTVVLIHTSMVFVKVETMVYDIVAEVMPDVRLINFVDDSLLPDVMRAGAVTTAVSDRMGDLIVAAQKAGPDVILSLCSSLGPAVDSARARVSVPIVKIDDAMAQQAALAGGRVAVMATVPTTLKPTGDLIADKAKRSGTSVEVRHCLVEGAFNLLMRGEASRHDEMVIGAARDLAGQAAVLSVRSRVAPRSLSYRQLREKLVERGIRFE